MGHDRGNHLPDRISRFSNPGNASLAIITTRVKHFPGAGDILTPQGECMDNSEQVKAVQRMQAYIEAHLHESITLHMLACAAGYSPWHAAKVFKSLTGKSPFEYIRAVRLWQAAGGAKTAGVRDV